jgi:hypothetical protein
VKAGRCARKIKKPIGKIQGNGTLHADGGIFALE